MGTDLMRCKFQKQVEGGWVDVDEPEGCDFTDGRSYAFYGWLANVRNYSAVTPLAPMRGLPDDIVEQQKKRQKDRHPLYDSDTMEDYDYRDYSWSWLSVDEFRAVDYDQVVEDRRCTIGNNGGCTCEPGQGRFMPLREFLDEHCMSIVERLMASDVERIVFGFD